MPTTLFVLVNAVINAFRLVDHLFILTRGGPDNASTLLLYHLYEVGFKFWDTGYAAAITVVLVVVLAAVALLQFFVLDKRCTTNERRTHCPAPCAARAVRRHLAGHAGRLAAGPAVDTAAGLCVLDGLPSARILGTLRPGRALDAGELSPCLAGRALARYFLNTAVLVVMILAAQLVLGTLAALRFARGQGLAFALVLVQLMIMPDILLVANYQTLSRLGAVDTLLGIGLPYFASAFAIFLLRQTFLGIPGNWTRPRGWRAPAPCRSCGASTCRWRGPCTWRLRWCR